MASWLSLCSRKAAARGQLVKLVFPGGHVELLDRPVPAAEVMARHPRFVVARPDVFRDPAAAGAVAAPDAVLALGRKYYVVPKSTVRRLLRNASSPLSSAGGGAGGVSLKRHLAGGGSGGRSKSWLRLLVGGSGGDSDGDEGDQKAVKSRTRREGVSHVGEDEAAVVGEVDVREKGKKTPSGGSPGRRRRRIASSPANSASFSWQPSLHSITEE